jgi:hypothetical protein
MRRRKQWRASLLQMGKAAIIKVVVLLQNIHSPVQYSDTRAGSRRRWVVVVGGGAALWILIPTLSCTLFSTSDLNFPRPLRNVSNQQNNQTK